MATNKQNFINFLTIIILLLIHKSHAFNSFGEPIQVELEIPDDLQEDFKKFSDIIDMGDVYTYKYNKKLII